MLAFVRIILISGALTAILPAVQGFTGFVVDDQNQPVDFATIRTQHSQTWIISDEYGFFMFPSNLSRGDSLVVSRIGFQNASVSVPNSQSVIIRLQRNIIPLSAVNVTGSFSFGNTEWNSKVLSETDGISRTRALQSLDGSLLKTYGGRAGIMLLGLDGGKPEHTKIVLDGIDLTSPQNGQTDLSEIPSDYYEQMFIAKAPGIEFGSGAMDGVIHLKPWHRQSKLSLSSGSFGYRSESIRFNVLDRAPFGLSFIAGQARETGNYDYSNNGVTAARENNDFEQQYGGINVRWNRSKKTMFNSSLYVSQTNRGAAGPVSYPSASARRNNDLILANSSVYHLFPSGHIAISVNHRSNDEHYSDPGTDTSRHQVSSENITVRLKKNLLSNLQIHGSAEFRKEAVESTSLENRSRNNTSASFAMAYTPWKAIRVQPAVRLDKSDDLHKSYDLQVHASLPFSIQLKAAAGTGFHLPNFNDLFWPQDAYTAGNSLLKPEESSFTSVSIRMALIKNGTVGMSLRSRKSKNLISWASGSDWVWRPENIDKSFRKTASISFTSPQWINGLDISGDISVIETKNEITNENLEYVPDQSASVNIRYSYKIVNLDLMNHYTGKRTYTGYDENFNSVEKVIDPMSNVTLGIHISVPQLPSAKVHMVMENVLDSDISFFPDYPEPGRSITGGFSFRF